MGAELAMITAVFGSVLVLTRVVFALVLATEAVRRHADFEIEITPSSAVNFRITHQVDSGPSGAFGDAQRGAVGQIAQGPQHGPLST